MPSFQEARRIILESVSPLGAEIVPALEAVGRVLAEDVRAPFDLPRWDNSAMDGFALRAQDADRPGGLRVSGYVPAGTTPAGAVAEGTAVRVLTGAPIPPGADAVVPVEHTEEQGGTVRPLRPIGAGQNVRRRGEDIRAGEVVLAAGTVLGPAELSALASCSRLAVVALVTSAGVSVGDRDLVREVLEELGVRQLFWKIDIKPGRPTAFALAGRTPVFSLPGNPVATLLTFDQLVRPALLRAMGHERVLRPLVPAALRDGLRRKPGRVEFVRVRLERSAGALVATSAGDQATGMLGTLLRADGIVVVPADRGTIEPGGAVEVQVLRGELERWDA